MAAPNAAAKAVTCTWAEKTYSVGAPVAVNDPWGSKGGTFAAAQCRICQTDGLWSEPVGCT